LQLTLLDIEPPDGIGPRKLKHIHCVTYLVLRNGVTAFAEQAACCTMFAKRM